MAALTADRDTKRRDGVQYEFPVAANTTLYAGGIACVNASNYATPGATATTLKSVGVVEETVTNGAVAGAVRVKVRRGVYRFANSAAGDAIALADVGADCYIVDDQTVAKTTGSATRSVAGVVRDVDADGVWVEL
jgi:hypothetical protein